MVGDYTEESAVDAALVAAVVEGDERAFEKLVRRHLRSALAVAGARLAIPSDAEDVCQEAFMIALQRIEQCRDPSRFRGWFLTIVKNRAHSRREYEAVRAAADIDDTQIPDGSGSAERTLELEELRGELEEALSHLSELQRRVIVLHDMEGWKHQEIARRLAISYGSSRVHLHKARRRMRDLLRGRK